MSRLLFIKEGHAIWSSHLDLMRALMRSFRRAGIALKHSQGFTPHPELSILMPLSVGVESRCEIAEFTLAEGCTVPAEEIAARMNPVLPAGLRAIESWDGGKKAGKLAWLRARLTLTYDAPCVPTADESPVTGHQSPGGGGCGAAADGQQATEETAGSGAQCALQEAAGEGEKRILRSAQNDRVEALAALFARPSIVVEKHGKKGAVETDIAPMIRELTIKATGNRQQATGDGGSGLPRQCAYRLAMTGSELSPAVGGDVVVIEAVVAAQNPTLNPLLLVTAIETYLSEYKPDHVQCGRIEIYDADMNVFR